MLIPPLRPTFARWKKLSFGPMSLLRSLQYEIVRGLTLKGRILDVGGGKNADYTRFLKVDGQLDSINVSAKYEPTYLADANKPWPVETGIYDTLISLNTFEHLERDVFALEESLRTLKSGGTFHILVPFLYRVHASPFDYHRHTHYAWERILEDLGVPASHQRIEPMGWDTMAIAFSFLETTRLRILKPLTLLVGVLRCISMKGDRLPEDVAAHWREWPVGYYISGTKP